MKVLGIDPGTEKSALVLLDGKRVTWFATLPNAEVVHVLGSSDVPDNRQPQLIGIEMIASYGMPVGAEVFETCVWIGRFIEAYNGTAPIERIKRIEVKSHLCHSGKAKDGHIRQALIDRYGGKEKAIGRKKTPGPLYGISEHEWAALAVAVTVADQAKEAA